MLLKAENVFLISTKDRKSHLLLGIMTTEDFTSSFRLTLTQLVREPANQPADGFVVNRNAQTSKDGNQCAFSASEVTRHKQRARCRGDEEGGGQAHSPPIGLHPHKGGSAGVQKPGFWSKKKKKSASHLFGMGRRKPGSSEESLAGNVCCKHADGFGSAAEQMFS